MEPFDAHVKPGQRIDEYVVKEQIAIGGFGTVWRANHVETDTIAAIKVLHAHLVSSETLILRLEREARAIASMRHPNIVELYAHGRLPDGRPYLVMEYLTGRDLGTHLALRGTLSPSQIAPILEQLCKALSAAHNAGI
ncbi:MAG: protein kinase, partial [Myxococcota bacterium]